MSQNRFNTYSVFVGHIQPGTSKKDLKDLFMGCGPVSEVVIMEKEESSFSYGFVRYHELVHAQRAIAEMNRWRMNGQELIVDMSKDTVAKIEREKQVLDKRLEPKVTKCQQNVSQQNVSQQNVSTQYVSRNIKDMMFLSRLKEACILTHVTESQGGLNTTRLLDDVHKSKSGLLSLWGTPSLEGTTVQAVSNRVSQSCPPSVSDAFQVFVETLVNDIQDVTEVDELNISTNSSLAETEAVSDASDKMTLADIRQACSTSNFSDSKNVYVKDMSMSDIPSSVEYSKKCETSTCQVVESLSTCVNNQSATQHSTVEEHLTLSKQEARIIKFLRSAMPYIGQNDEELDHYLGELSGEQIKKHNSDTTVLQTQPVRNETEVRQTQPNISETKVRQIQPAISETNIPRTQPAISETNIPQTQPAISETNIPRTQPISSETKVRQTQPVSSETKVRQTQPVSSETKVRQTQPVILTTLSLLQQINVNNEVKQSNHEMCSQVPSYNAEQQDTITYEDPAIVDFHLSRLSSPEKESNYNRQEDQHNVQTDGISVLDSLFLKARSNCMMRLESRSSDMSEGSNEGSVEDSGFESDNLVKTTAGPQYNMYAGLNRWCIPCGRGAQLRIPVKRPVGVRPQAGSSVCQTGIGRQSSLLRVATELGAVSRPGNLENLVRGNKYK